MGLMAEAVGDACDARSSHSLERIEQILSTPLSFEIRERIRWELMRLWHRAWEDAERMPEALRVSRASIKSYDREDLNQELSKYERVYNLTSSRLEEAFTEDGRIQITDDYLRWTALYTAYKLLVGER